jgi:hypothetical protein
VLFLGLQPTEVHKILQNAFQAPAVNARSTKQQATVGRKRNYKEANNKRIKQFLK